MKKYIAYLLVLGLFVSFVGCSSDEPDTPPVVPGITLNNPVNDFVWRGLNSEYYWQNKVTNLSDTKNNDQDTYYTYLNTYSTPNDLFNSLIYQPGEVDRFSWFIEDYAEQEASFRGVSDSFGFEFDLSLLCEGCEEVIGFIYNVTPDSPASEAGLKRGDIFSSFNGITLTTNNYQVVNKYFTDDNISFGLAQLEDGKIVDSNEEVSLTIREVIANPIFYSNVITNGQGTKIGYLAYDGFKYPFHQQLNDVFDTFKSQGIQELILDLRNNGGGAVLTSAYLASMIYAGAAAGDVFATLEHNSKNENENSYYPFFDEGYIYDIDGNDTGKIALNRLSSLSRLFVITSEHTASASEMIINGLSPFINVIKVGTTTYGKNVGSYTVYDSPDFSPNNVNQSHTMAMQPITFQIFNKSGESDYTKGFTPDYEIIDYINIMKPLGDEEEPLLNACLDIIAGNTSKLYAKKSGLYTKNIFSSLDKKKFSREMYIIPQER